MIIHLDMMNPEYLLDQSISLVKSIYVRNRLFVPSFFVGGLCINTLIPLQNDWIFAYCFLAPRQCKQMDQTTRSLLYYVIFNKI